MPSRVRTSKHTVTTEGKLAIKLDLERLTYEINSVPGRLIGVETMLLRQCTDACTCNAWVRVIEVEVGEVRAGVEIGEATTVKPLFNHLVRVVRWFCYKGRPTQVAE